LLSNNDLLNEDGIGAAVNVDDNFRALVDKLPILMFQLSNAQLRPWNNLGELPLKGIYVFYEDNVPIYVGRTNRIRKRIKEHGQMCSGHNKAPFAFNLAKKEAIVLGIELTVTRDMLNQDTAFVVLFLNAKKRVSNMSLRVVEIHDPIVQTLFEVYASMELKTNEYNSFENH